ncbi:helix-turn-helix domain-containing protein [Nocardia jiangxiensis]|uniref:Helix-turn-helix domain-containing protein n=1 Tax=Nocardia jiangxiensis TaxID=282685 RepID=A0ABW6RZ09_9NOCA|nr:helix-turn-helix transcriptional regulator [Nocardia jiangxiensis]
MGLPHGITGSTMPRRQLGRRLRDLRNRARMTTRVAAQRLEWSEAKIWRIETGQTSLRGLDVEAMCKIYGASAESAEPLIALARETKARGWWTEYSDVIPEGFEVYLGLEEAATRLATYENELVPGLLQTPDYARAVLTGSRPDISQVDVDRRVAVRLARQSVLTRSPNPLRLEAMITEALLWHRIGGAGVMAAQLDHLRRLCELPNIEIRVVPTDSGYHEGMDSGRFALLEFDDAAGELAEPPVVFVQNYTGTAYFDKENEITRYRQAFESIRAVTIDAREPLEQARAGLGT